MTKTKIFLSAMTMVVVLISAAWLLRNTLIQRISNPMLQEYGIAVTDVSLDALATSDATIGSLKLVHDKGTTIVIENLTLPIGESSTGSKNYTADSITVITATRGGGEPFDLAQLVGQIVSLHGNLGDSTLAIAEFNLPPYPTVRNLHWVLTEKAHTLSARVEAVEMSATATRIDASSHNVVFALPAATADATGNSITVKMQQGDHGIVLKGQSALNLSAWEALTKMAGIVPQEISFHSGAASLQLDVEIPADLAQSPSVTAALTQSSPWKLAYSVAPGEIATITVLSGSTVDLAATFPGVAWSLQQSRTSLQLSYNDWTEIPLALANISCKTGPVCSMDTRVEIGNSVLPPGKVGRLEFSSSENIVFTDDGLRVELQPDATLLINELSSGDMTVAEISARTLSVATLELVEAGWRISASSLDASVGGFSMSDDFSVTAPLFIENLHASELGRLSSAGLDIYAPSSDVVLGVRTVALPGFKGKVSLNGSQVAADLQTVGLHQNGDIATRHDLESGAGNVHISNAAISFSERSLSNRISPRNDDWDFAQGVASLGLQASWDRDGSDLGFDGQMSVRVEELAGHYADTAFVGLRTSFESNFDSSTGFTAKPSSIDVALIEMGLPVENISANYAVDPNALSVDVENLRMTAFGGVISADPFSFRTATTSNSLVLHAESIELDALLTLKEFEAIEVSGSIGALLPIVIEGDSITIENGKLFGEAPGGVIRYRPDFAPDAADASSIGLVTRALSNFEYESLTSEVDYTVDGDLNLQLHLTGRNPDLDEKRPVVLNLGVENNVPQMLKSLRAARAVEEILEKRLEK